MTKVVNLSRTIFFEICACLEMWLEMFLLIYLFFLKVISIVSLIYLYSVSVHFFLWHFILDFDDLATTLSLSVSVVTVSGSQDNPRVISVLDCCPPQWNKRLDCCEQAVEGRTCCQDINSLYVGVHVASWWTVWVNQPVCCLSAMVVLRTKSPPLRVHCLTVSC